MLSEVTLRIKQMISPEKTDMVTQKEQTAIPKVAKQKIAQMSEDIERICKALSQSSKDFDKIKVFEQIDNYINTHDRLMYAEISNYIFQLQSDQEVSVFQTNLESVLEFVLSDEYSQQINTKKDEKDKTKITRSRKIVLKLYDHVNLARRQYIELRETDEEFERRFDKYFSEHQLEITKEMSNQLVTLVGIFTAIAFVVFGGISSLDDIFRGGMSDIPLLRLMILGTLWSLCMTNLLYIFLFCVGKITKLSIKSSDRPDDNLVQKYPIIFWSNYIFISLTIVLCWLYFLNNHGHFKWLHVLADKDSITTNLIGFVVIVLLLMIGAYILYSLRQTNHQSTN